LRKGGSECTSDGVTRGGNALILLRTLRKKKLEYLMNIEEFFRRLVFEPGEMGVVRIFDGLETLRVDKMA
jgi:hypothetical protein